MTQAVKDILARMQLELPPPIHLRGNPDAQKQFLADYVQVLSGWSREILEAAWPVVLSRQEFWIWPRPQQIHDACKQIASQRQQPINLEERQREAQELVDRYMSNYLRRSQLTKLAEKEGWINSLKHFVRESAWVQAQLLCKINSIGWDRSIATHLGEFHSSQEAFTAFRQTIAGAIQRGRIEVHVPPTLIRAVPVQILIAFVAELRPYGFRAVNRPFPEFLRILEKSGATGSGEAPVPRITRQFCL